MAKLSQAVSRVLPVIVVAPDRNWSIAGHTKTIFKPIYVFETTLTDGTVAYATDGAPSDCVSLTVLGLFGHKPSLVVAGINKGPNLGEDITYSGTVAAAMEGVISGIPSIAVSLNAYENFEFDAAAEFAADLARHVVENHLSSEVLLNVNVPAVPKSELRGVAITRLGKRIYRDVLTERTDDNGRQYYWIEGDVPDGLREQGTDLLAVEEKMISITPIHLDLTNHSLIEGLKGWDLWKAP